MLTCFEGTQFEEGANEQASEGGRVCTYSGREYVGRVNYKCVEGASENARSRGTGSRGRGPRRRRKTETVLGGARFRRTHEMEMDLQRSPPSAAARRPFVLPLAARRIFIPMRTTDGRDGAVASPSSSSPTASSASPSFLPFPLQRPILRARANKRDSRPFISLRVNSLNGAGVAQ